MNGLGHPTVTLLRGYASRSYQPPWSEAWSQLSARPVLNSFSWMVRPNPRRTLQIRTRARQLHTSQPRQGDGGATQCGETPARSCPAASLPYTAPPNCGGTRAGSCPHRRAGSARAPLPCAQAKDRAIVQYKHRIQPPANICVLDDTHPALGAPRPPMMRSPCMSGSLCIAAGVADQGVHLV